MQIARTMLLNYIIIENGSRWNLISSYLNKQVTVDTQQKLNYVILYYVILYFKLYFSLSYQFIKLAKTTFFSASSDLPCDHSLTPRAAFSERPVILRPPVQPMITKGIVYNA